MKRLGLTNRMMYNRPNKHTANTQIAKQNSVCLIPILIITSHIITNNYLNKQKKYTLLKKINTTILIFYENGFSFLVFIDIYLLNMHKYLYIFLNREQVSLHFCILTRISEPSKCVKEIKIKICSERCVFA